MWYMACLFDKPQCARRQVLLANMAMRASLDLDRPGAARRLLFEITGAKHDRRDARTGRHGRINVTRLSALPGNVGAGAVGRSRKRGPRKQENPYLGFRPPLRILSARNYNKPWVFTGAVIAATCR